MKLRKMILMNRKGDFFIFWQSKKKIYIESKFGTIFTHQTRELLGQIILDLRKDELVYIGDV